MSCGESIEKRSGEERKERKERKKSKTRTNNDNGSSSIANLLILSARKLNHTLSSRMDNINLPQNSITIVGEDNTAHGIKEHLEHGLGPQAGPDQVCHRFPRHNVPQLCLSSLHSLCVLLCVSSKTVRFGVG